MQTLLSWNAAVNVATTFTSLQRAQELFAFCILHFEFT